MQTNDFFTTQITNDLSKKEKLLEQNNPYKFTKNIKNTYEVHIDPTYKDKKYNQFLQAIDDIDIETHPLHSKITIDQAKLQLLNEESKQNLQQSCWEISLKDACLRGKKERLEAAKLTHNDIYQSCQLKQKLECRKDLFTHSQIQPLQAKLDKLQNDYGVAATKIIKDFQDVEVKILKQEFQQRTLVFIFDIISGVYLHSIQDPLFTGIYDPFSQHQTQELSERSRRTLAKYHFAILPTLPIQHELTDFFYCNNHGELLKLFFSSDYAPELLTNFDYLQQGVTFTMSHHRLPILRIHDHYFNGLTPSDIKFLESKFDVVNELINHLILTPRFNLQLTHHINRTKSIAKTIQKDSKQLLQNAKKLSQLQQASKLSDQIFKQIIKKADKDLHNNYLNYLHDLIGGRKKPQIQTKQNKNTTNTTNITRLSNEPTNAGRTTPIIDNTHKQSLVEEIQRCEATLNQAKDKLAQLTNDNKQTSTQKSRPQINDLRSAKDKIKQHPDENPSPTPQDHNDRHYRNDRYYRNDQNHFSRGARPYRGRPYKRYCHNDRSRNFNKQYDNNYDYDYDKHGYYGRHNDHHDKSKDQPRHSSNDTQQNNQSPTSNWGKPPPNTNSNYGWGTSSQTTPSSTGWGTSQDTPTWDTPQRKNEPPPQSSHHSSPSTPTHNEHPPETATADTPEDQHPTHKRQYSTSHKRRSASSDYRADQQRRHRKRQASNSQSSNRRKHHSKRKRSPSPNMNYSPDSTHSDSASVSPSPSPDPRPHQSKRTNKHTDKKRHRWKPPIPSNQRRQSRQRQRFQRRTALLSELKEQDTINVITEQLTNFTHHDLHKPPPNFPHQSTQDKCKFYYNTFATFNKREDLTTLRTHYKIYQPFDGQPSHSPVHNLCDEPDKVPKELIQILGLGLGFRLALPRSHEDKHLPDFHRFKREIRIKHFFQQRNTSTDPNASDSTEQNDHFNKKLYVKSTWEPDPIHPDVELALETFEQTIRQTFHQSRQTLHKYNLDPEHITLLRKTKKDNYWSVVDTDKGLGPAIIETKKLFKIADEEHLSNTNNYRELSKENAERINLSTFHRICKLMIDKPFDEESHKFFTHRLIGTQPRRDQFQRVIPLPHLQLPYFYVLPKVHKKPWKTRPVVSSVSTALEPLSQWIDDQLQKVIHLCPAYLKDSWHLLNKLKDIHRLPSDARLFTVDAVAMYANIPTPHGLETIEKWLYLHYNQLPAGFPIKRIMEGLTIVMNYNIFSYGNRFFQQRNGTAMGTPCACAFATIYYSYHEETELMHIYKLPKPIFYGRLIDDALVIIRHTLNNYDNFCSKMNSFKDVHTHQGLEWEAETPSKTVNFLDLTITINEEGFLFTKTYQKPMNLYLYRPPTSNQPASILNGMIYSTLHRYLWQNSRQSDFMRVALKFMMDLERRGHQTSKLLKLFQTNITKLASSKMPTIQTNTPTTSTIDDRCFLHLTFHRQNPPNHTLQKAFADHCQPIFEEHNIPISTMTIANHSSESISQSVKVNRLKENTNTMPNYTSPDAPNRTSYHS